MNRRHAVEKRILRAKVPRPARACPPALEWLAEAVSSGPRITLFGGARALVEGHQGLLECTPQCVRLRGSRGEMTIRGENLTLGELRSDGLTVCGAIASVELSGGENHA